MISRYGYDNFFALIAVGILVAAAGVFLCAMPIPALLLIVAGFVICAFALWFFRDPLRTPPQQALHNDAVLIAPADGKVTQIETVYEQRWLNAPARQISIFLSPLDVHVNRVPANGIVGFTDYRPGKFLMAFSHEASEENEQSIIGLENSAGKLVFKQITGFLARRIVYELKDGDAVRAGDKFGMMKFGSRMDVIVPEGSEILVKIGDRVVGGETIIGTLP